MLCFCGTLVELLLLLNLLGYLNLATTRAASLSGNDGIATTIHSEDSSFSSNEILSNSDKSEAEVVKCVCDGGGCEHLRAEECRHGVTFDMCRCCLVCARGESEPCGDAQGTCAFGLHCQLNSDERINIKQAVGSRHGADTFLLSSQEGVCSRVGKCGQLVDQYGCVVDPEGKCICLTRRACPGEKVFLFKNKSSCQGRMAFLIAKKDLEPVSSLEALQLAQQTMTNKENTTITDNCSQVKCPPVEPCPEDSYRLPSVVSTKVHRRRSINEKTSLIQPGCCNSANARKCQCVPNLLCPSKVCPPGWKLRIGRNATGKPGGCCPKFECVPSPVSTSHTHSLHQFRSPNHTQHHQNHHKSQRHHQFSIETNSDLSNFENRLRDGISKEHGKPLLNDEFNSEKNCYHSARIFKSGESWNVQNECTECFCKDGLVLCKPIICNVSSKCTFVKVQLVSCCPICEGGTPVRKSEHIAVDKKNCPFYDCHNIIRCPTGFQLDTLGCPTCECQKCQSLVDCKLSCPTGFHVDDGSNGCKVCKCHGNKLRPSTSWSRNENKNLANKHHSQKIHSVSSSERSQNDWPWSFEKVDEMNLLGNSGGQYHHHLDHYDKQKQDGEQDINDHEAYYSSQYVNSYKRSSTLNSSGDTLALFCAMDSDGVKRMEGEEWADHCRQCVCRNGKEMCSLIACPAPTCEHPILYQGECCPRCAESASTFNSVNVSICLSTDGTKRMEGEMWTLSNCLTCTCHSSQVLCAVQECPPAPCPSPKLVDCCLQCPSVQNEKNNKNSSSNNSISVDSLATATLSKFNTNNCFSEASNKTYENGDTWKVGSCKNCRCDTGQIQCFPVQKCPLLNCARPVLAKNQCCPICLEKGIQKSVVEHHGVEGAIQLEHLHSAYNGKSLLSHDLDKNAETIASSQFHHAGSGFEPHCAVLIACLLVVTILTLLYIVRQVCFHRRAFRRHNKKMPVCFHSSSSFSHSTPDSCCKCDFSKDCRVGGRRNSNNTAKGKGECYCSSETRTTATSQNNRAGSSATNVDGCSNSSLSAEEISLFQHAPS